MSTVRGKLMVLLVGIASAAVLLACISFVLYDQSSYAEKKMDTMGVLSDSVASAAYGPAAFGDPESTAYVLNTFSAEETAEFSAVYGSDGAVLAAWSSGDQEVPTTVDASPASAAYAQGHLRVLRPVEKNGERVGTLVASFGTGDIQERQNRFIAIAGGVLAVSMLVSLVLAIWAQRFFTRQVGELATAATELAEKGSYDVRVKRVSNDELGDLADSFNTMVEAIESRDAELAGHAESLEATVEERTRDLRARNDAIRLILDNIDQGLVVIASDGKIGEERSAAFDALVGTPKPGDLFAENLELVAPGTGAMLEVGLDQTFDGIMPPEVSLDQLPASVHLADGRSLSLSYRLVEGEELRVLAIVSDITAATKRRERDASQQQLLAALRLHQEGGRALRAALDEAAHIVKRATQPTGDRTVLLRDLHTLKGNFSVLGLQALAGLVHELESEVIESGAGLRGISAARLSSAWREFTGELNKVLGDSTVETITIERSEYDAVAVPVLRVVRGTVAKTFERWGLEANDSRFRQLSKEVERLSRVRDMDVKVRIEDEVEYLPGDTNWIWTAMPHLVRNAVDHGLMSLGASPRQRMITMRCKRDGDKLVFSVSDNGMGISWDALRAKAKESGLPVATKEDLQEVLFSDGVSTKTEVTTTSGRGVGLSAVRHDVRAHGGSIRVDSVKGKGTTFSIEFAAPTSALSHAA
ncbi:MAG: HAMP domain-containing protein [Nannocystaceae bacterium]|nr:HAMP domain-containing protein [Nannocystaceae bacterium]